jgi:hypothetical protein
MYQPRRFGKKDQVRFWSAPDRVFFAAGACHVLAHAFVERFPDAGFRPIWIRPAPGFWGNHVLVTNGEIAFDYHGYSRYAQLLDHFTRRARLHYPGWEASVVQVTVSLVNHDEAKTIGLHIREPNQFLHDALPRARRFLARFDPLKPSYI